MEDDLPPTVKTNTNTDSSDNLKPDSAEPWQSNPDESTEVVIDVTLPTDAEITEVTLKDPDNVDDYTVTVTDSNGNTISVNFVYTIWNRVYT